MEWSLGYECFYLRGLFIGNKKARPKKKSQGGKKLPLLFISQVGSLAASSRGFSYEAKVHIS